MNLLPLANVWHYKLRSVLSAFGIGIGICMLVVLSGLSRGSLSEVADRWESVNADLIACPRGYEEEDNNNIITLSGLGIRDSFARHLLTEHKDMVERACPVFLYNLKIAKRDNMATGMEAGDWDIITGGKKLIDGRLPDADGRFAAWYDKRFLEAGDKNAVIATPEQQQREIADHGGFEMVVDELLARMAKLQVGDDVTAGQHTWRIVGIAPRGVITRVFIPRRTAQHVFGHSSLFSTLQFVKLRKGVDPAKAKAALTDDDGGFLFVTEYRQKLTQKFQDMLTYITAVNIIALIIAFLFIMNTLYTMVLQRTREIAILKSCGASNAFILRQILGESLLLTALGVAMGLAITWPAKWGIELAAPQLTVTISWQLILAGIGAALAGATVSAIYPAYRATRVDMVEALTLE